MHDQYDGLTGSNIFKEEAFVVEVQSLLQTVMNERGYSRADLARALGVSRARVTQIFSDECKNLTIRLLARAVAVMGDRIEVSSESYRCAQQRNEFALVQHAVSNAENVHPCWEFAGGIRANNDTGMDVAADSTATKAAIAGTLRRRDESLRQRVV